MQAKEPLTIFVMEPERDSRVVRIPHTLEAMQEIVDGNFEHFFRLERSKSTTFDFYGNDSAKLLPTCLPNFYLPPLNDWIFGPVFIAVGNTHTGETSSLNALDISLMRTFERKLNRIKRNTGFTFTTTEGKEDQ